ncbi:cytochrome c oxidase assembly protein [Falsibacillus albus]|uniref:Cytochrome c oxidase assembly factor CtaG n=1 Tax=Falsibacillus albus TaxID=2478915 RepID=A0A3L7K5U3_9BACI|nr:cytochrome c oxidase assembly protein [Falsibacillus albus]RLQ97461.1 hypothetical protein D9X91_04735 [Falsibacillus albus]
MHTLSLLTDYIEWDLPLLIGLTFSLTMYLFWIKCESILGQPSKRFFLSMGLLYVTIGSPFRMIIHLAFFIHMTQMSILFFIIPPILLSGLPEVQIINRFMKFHFVNLLLFAVMLFFYHLPFMLVFFFLHPTFHQIYFIGLCTLSFSMWWPIAAKDSRTPFTQNHKRIYILFSGLLITPACLIFIINALPWISENPFLKDYSANLCNYSQIGPISSFTPIAINERVDQLLAGILMMLLHKVGLMLANHLQKQEKMKQEKNH